jgi:hypothetical protein
MENEIGIRRFVRQTLSEAVFKLRESTEPMGLGESDKIMADIVGIEEIRAIQKGQDNIDENCLDDKKPQGNDKIMQKINDKLG